MSVQTMESMIKWIDENMLEDSSLDSMASFVGYSSYYCSKKFHEYTGITYKKYLAKCKLNVAAKLLLTSDEKIVDIALKCGYVSPESFSRAFVEAYQYTPTQYRKAYV